MTKSRVIYTILGVDNSIVGYGNISFN